MLFLKFYALLAEGDFEERWLLYLDTQSTHPRIRYFIHIPLPSFLVYFSPSERCKQSQSHVFCFNLDPDPKLFPSQTDSNTNRDDATLFWSLVSVHGPKLRELVTVSIQVRAYNIVIEQKLTDSVAEVGLKPSSFEAERKVQKSQRNALQRWAWVTKPKLGNLLF